jgi:hypothetical protein
MRGEKAETLRRLVERHADDEGDERVARLSHGIVARRRKDLGRWTLHVPRELLTDGARP